MRLALCFFIMAAAVLGQSLDAIPVNKYTLEASETSAWSLFFVCELDSHGKNRPKHKLWLGLWWV